MLDVMKTSSYFVPVECMMAQRFHSLCRLPGKSLDALVSSKEAAHPLG